MNKNNILDAWIMIERLSEGNIDTSKKEILLIDRLENNNYYHFFQEAIKNHLSNDNKNGGIAVYFDVFNFNETIKLLREKYMLAPTEEEIKIGEKFAFALYFDKNLTFQKDMTFFTQCGYIRYNNDIPKQNEFSNYENEFKNLLQQKFDNTSTNANKFNDAIHYVLNKYDISIEKCRIQVIKNIETGCDNLHSFFIEDLEKAKNIDTQNLSYYLFGDSRNRVNLDSNANSENYNPDTFKDILQPTNYPLGRFPSPTKHSLFFMQQVVVNLSIGYDDKTIRSVNGPPGTGKTTLLKDIFAQLIVDQAYAITKLSNKKICGTNKTIYDNKSSIGTLPDIISEKGIVVVSSNNSAVRNIVNDDLPLMNQMDSAFKNKILDIDYFHDISNTDFSSKSVETDEEKQENISQEPNNLERWGLFSLEGGAKSNIDNILSCVKAIDMYFDEKYISDNNVYQQFLDKYTEVADIRDKMQKAITNNEKTNALHLEINIKTNNYKLDYNKKQDALNRLVNELQNKLERFEADKEQYTKELQSIEIQKENFIDIYNATEKLLDTLIKQKPGFLASKATKQAHKNKVDEVEDKFSEIVQKKQECIERENCIRKTIDQLERNIISCNYEINNAKNNFETWNLDEKTKIDKLYRSLDKYKIDTTNISNPLDMTKTYDDLHKSNPWFDESYRIAQSELFIKAMAVRKQFLYQNRNNLKAATEIWRNQNKYIDNKLVIEAAWGWLNMAIPVISSTFASFSRMCKYLGANTLGHLFIDEAGQAVPHAAVGAIFRSRQVMVVGDPSQIKPVLTLDSSVLSMLGKRFNITEKYLSDSASTQTLVDAASNYGFYRKQDKSDESWIGIPLWVHRRSKYPMFTISNTISYNGFMVHGNPGNGKTGWYDIKGKANEKYVEEQGEFLLQKIKKMSYEDPTIMDKIYVISPFSNVASCLAKKLKEIGFTKYEKGKPTNVGTVHTFQGKENAIVFMVLGADVQSKGAAMWAVSEPNIMNVAATRAKEEFYIIGDKTLYKSLGSEVVFDTYKVIEKYKNEYPELIDENTSFSIYSDSKSKSINASKNRIRGKIRLVRDGKKTKYAYITSDDGKNYTISEATYKHTPNADMVIIEKKHITFEVINKNGKEYATKIMPLLKCDNEV